MFVRSLTALTLPLLALMMLSRAGAWGQDSRPPAPAASPAAQAPPAADPQDAARKTQILNSPQWRRAMFEFKEWLSAQPFYTPTQVEQLKARFNQRVARMSSQELAYMLADMEQKFQILDTPQAQEARAWMAQYLSVMSDKKRAEVLKELPNLATMTADQLNAQLMKVEEKRADIEQRQAVFGRTQQAQVNAQLAQDRVAREDYIRDRNTAPATYSPYRSPNDVNRHLNYGRVGSGGMNYYVSPWGGVGINIGAW